MSLINTRLISWTVANVGSAPVSPTRPTFRYPEFFDVNSYIFYCCRKFRPKSRTFSHLFSTLQNLYFSSSVQPSVGLDTLNAIFLYFEFFFAPKFDICTGKLLPFHVNDFVRLIFWLTQIMRENFSQKIL